MSTLVHADNRWRYPTFTICGKNSSNFILLRLFIKIFLNRRTMDETGHNETFLVEIWFQYFKDAHKDLEP